MQRVIKQAQFDVVVPQKDNRPDVQKQYFAGTFMIMNGEKLGIGVWRTSNERTFAPTRGGFWMCSLMLGNKTDAPALAPVTSEAACQNPFFEAVELTSNSIKRPSHRRSKS